MVFCRQTTRAPDRQRCPPVHCHSSPQASHYSWHWAACQWCQRSPRLSSPSDSLPCRTPSASSACTGTQGLGQSWFSWAMASPLASCLTLSPTPALTFLLPGTDPNDQLLSTDCGQPAPGLLHPPPALERNLFKFHMWGN